MSQTEKLLLITRPIESAQKDAYWFAERSVQCIISPLLEYKNVEFTLEPAENYEGIIITSAQSVRALATHTKERNQSIFCVGDQSAEAAQEVGFNNVTSASGTAKELVELIKNLKRSNKPYLYARGENISENIQMALIINGIPCESITTYKAILNEKLTEPCVQAIHDGKIHAASFTSVRGAKNFARLVCVHNLSKHLKTIKALCLSNNVLEYIQPLEWGDTSVCPTPDGKVFKEFILQSY